MTDRHHWPAELLAASLDGPLTSGERLEVDRHAMDCAACRLLEHQLRADAAALAVRTTVTPSSAIRAEIERQVTIPPLDPTLVRSIRVGIVVAVLTLAIVLLAIGAALMQPRPTEPQQTREPEPIGLHLGETPW